MNIIKDQTTAQKDKALFNRIAKSYAKKDLHQSSIIARKLRLKQTLAKAKLDNTIDVLEIGCGAGFAAKYLERSYKNFTGIDYSDELIKYANLNNKKDNTTFISKDLYDYKTPHKFDVLFMIGVLHHMVDMEKAMSVAKSLLKPGGFIIANEPQKANLIIHLLRLIRSKIDKSYSEDQEELSNNQLLDLFKSTDLKKINTYPQGFFSTPFAEVVINPQGFFKHISRIACSIDKAIEGSIGKYFSKLFWNTIIIGQKEL